MLTPDSPGPDDVPSGGKVVWLDDHDFDHLFPKTTIDHLLSEEERKQAEQERKEFETVSRTLFLKHLEEFCEDLWPESEVYPIAYEVTSNCLASGMLSRDEFRESLSTSEGPLNPPLDRLHAILRAAYEDVLEGRPPRLSPPP